MEIRDNDKICIMAPLTPKLDKIACDRLYKKIMNDYRNVAIDLSYVHECSIDFIENIKQIAKTKKIGIFNIPSDIFVLFNIMDIDKHADLYVSELDFKENQRTLINRKFSLV